MKKLDSIKITKSDEKVIYAIGCLTLQERKKATKTTHAQIGLFCGCSEKTVQRSISKLEKAKLITRGRPKWKKSAWFINISTDFYQETKTIFHDQKKLSIQARNVHTGRTISINNSISFNNKNSLQNKTITEINESGVEFFISDKILELDLKNLNDQCGLNYSDLEFISRKTGWLNRELQYSIDNFALALETKTFIATQLSPREAFISIITGNNKREPRLFNKPQELIKIEAKRIKEQSKQEIINQEERKQSQEEIQIQTVKENYWFSISDEKKQKYLKESHNDLHGAIELANSRVCTDHDEFSLSKILKSLDMPELPHVKIQSTEETKTIFHDQKKLSIQAQNVYTGRTMSINNSISFPKENSFQNKTITEIKKYGVEFFISDKILELDFEKTEGPISGHVQFISPMLINSTDLLWENFAVAHGSSLGILVSSGPVRN